MKKLLVIILMLSLVLSLAACKDVSKPEVADEGRPAVEGEGPMKIMLLLPGSAGDKSFNDSAIVGLETLKEKYGDKVEVKYAELGMDETKYEPALYSASEDGWDVIVSLGFGFIDSLTEVAPQFPDTNYILCDAVVEADNVLSIVYKPYEGSFLIGYLGAKLSENNQLGFLGAMDIPLINDFLVGYIQGAQYASEDIKVKIGYVGNFNDPAKAKEVSIAQFNNGVDICYNVAGGSGLGLIETAVEMKKYVFGVDSDQAMIFDETEPEKASVIPTSMVKDVGESIVNVIDKYIENNSTYGGIESLGLKEGVIRIADNKYYQEMVSEEIRLEIAKLAQKIIDGEITVNSVIGLTPDEINKIKDSVQ